MNGPSFNQVLSQLKQAIDIARLEAPLVLFFIGAGGSGKSTLASKFATHVSSQHIAIAKFDDCHELGMDRWEKHLHEHPDRESCIRAFVAKWLARIKARHANKKLIVCDVNTTPDVLRQILDGHPEIKASILLVQPSNDVRLARLANDASRQHMPKEALAAQFDSGFADLLTLISEQLGIPRIFNEEDGKSIVEVAEAAIKLIRN